MNNLELDQMQYFLSLQSDEVQKNAVIVSPQDMNSQYALHIDKNTPKVFIPQMPKSAMPSENNTTARVTVATSLLGCYIGYFRGEFDATHGSTIPTSGGEHYAGGYAICKLDYKYALKPNDQLVGDAFSSEELWLVPYNPKHAEYVPVIVGKIFVSEMSFHPVSGDHPKVSITFYLENNDPNGMWIDKKNKVDVGYYAIHVDWPSVFDRTVSNDNIVIKQIMQDDYLSNKNKKAALLAMQADKLPHKPNYLSW